MYMYEVFSSHEPFHLITFSHKEKLQCSELTKQDPCLWMRVREGVTKGHAAAGLFPSKSRRHPIPKIHIGPISFAIDIYSMPTPASMSQNSCVPIGSFLGQAECARLRLNACLWWISGARACLLSFSFHLQGVSLMLSNSAPIFLHFTYHEYQPALRDYFPSREVVVLGFHAV
jgi:hypothetical protein